MKVGLSLLISATAVFGAVLLIGGNNFGLIGIGLAILYLAIFSE